MIALSLAWVALAVVLGLYVARRVPTSHARTWKRYAHESTRRPRKSLASRTIRYMGVCS